MGSGLTQLHYYRRHRRRTVLLPVILGVLLAGAATAACQQQKTTRQAGRETVDSIFLTSTSGIQKRERAVVTDSLSWVRMWIRLTADHVIPLPRPEIGFDSNIVVVAAAGATGPGHSIRIDSVVVKNSGLEIYVRETIIPPCSVSDMMMRYPAHAVRLRRAVQSVRFVEDSTVKRCPRL